MTASKKIQKSKTAPKAAVAKKTEAVVVTVATTPKVEAPKTPAPATSKVKVAKVAKTPKAKAHKPGCTMSGIDAAAAVLAESPTPLTSQQIVDAAKAKGLWASDAKTPAATIYASMLIEMTRLGDKARFVRSGRGVWTRSGLAALTNVAKPAAATTKTSTTVVLPGKKS